MGRDKISHRVRSTLDDQVGNHIVSNIFKKLQSFLSDQFWEFIFKSSLNCFFVDNAMERCNLVELLVNAWFKKSVSRAESSIASISSTWQRKIVKVTVSKEG